MPLETPGQYKDPKAVTPDDLVPEELREHVLFIEWGPEVPFESLQLKNEVSQQLSDKRRSVLEQQLKMVAAALSAPLIVDNFTSHFDRKEWEKHIESTYPQYKGIFDRNKMSVTGARSAVPLLSMWGSDFVDLPRIPKTLEVEFDSNYWDFKSNERKIQAFQSLDRWFEMFLAYFTDYQPQLPPLTEEELKLAS